MTDVSIIIPNYNYSKFLPDAINSAIEQSIECEVIVVDDGSTDNSVDVAKKFPVKLLLKKRGGIAALTRNSGIKIAKGNIIIILDADDKLMPWFAEVAKKMLDSDKSIDGVVGHARMFGTARGIWHSHELSKALKIGNNIMYCGAIRKSVFDKIGLFSQDIPTQGLEDWEFWHRMYKNGYKVGLINEPIFHYRKHSKSCSAVRKVEKWTILTKFFDEKVNK